MNLKNKTVFITGASRGIGLAIAVKLASKGANIAIVSKTEHAHEKLPGTIYTAAKKIESVGGRALPICCDIRYDTQVEKAVQLTIKQFKTIDIVINNASAISLGLIEELSLKKFDLMHRVNSRGTYLVVKKCLPYLKNSMNPHILTLAPPINLSK